MKPSTIRPPRIILACRRFTPPSTRTRPDRRCPGSPPARAPGRAGTPSRGTGRCVNPLVSPSSWWRTRDFNPRSPYGERLGRVDGEIPVSDFNPRSPYGERLVRLETEGRCRHISIHAPRMGSDLRSTTSQRACRDFNPRSPYGERHRASHRFRRCSYFNPRSPYGERRAAHALPASLAAISIHAPRMGSDSKSVVYAIPATVFQSTLPVWGATSRSRQARHTGENFNPRSPYGERHWRHWFWPISLGFQSTLPVWGATAKRCVCTNSSPAYCMRPISSRLRKAESAGNMFKNWCEATQQYVRSSPSHPTNKLQG